MSRRYQEDPDETRLPDGMQRVGYDADTQTYSYQDQDGSYWEGDPGARYGELHRSGQSSRSMTVTEAQAIRDGDRVSWRLILPFFLLIAVSLLTLYRFVRVDVPALVCENGSVRYYVKPGDSCWAIANGRGVTVEELTRLNPNMKCEVLRAGMEICVPENK